LERGGATAGNSKKNRKKNAFWGRGRGVKENTWKGSYTILRMGKG